MNMKMEMEQIWNKQVVRINQIEHLASEEMVNQFKVPRQLLWHIYHNTVAVPKCLQCGGSVSWLTFVRGRNDPKISSDRGCYARYCSKACANKCSELRNQKSEVMKEKASEISSRQKEFWNKQTNKQKQVYVDKVKKSCLEKYGVTSPTKTKEYREKRKAQNMEKYGVEYYSQTTEYKEKVKSSWDSKTTKEIDAIVSKRKRTNNKKYGADHYVLSSKYKKTKFEEYYDNILSRVKEKVIPLFSKHDYKGIGQRYDWECVECKNHFQDHLDNGKIPRCPKCYPFMESQPEKSLLDYVKSLGVEVIRNDRSILQGKEIDILIPEYNLGIEFNGVYWHSESKGKDKQYHLNKTIEAEKYGIRLIHIWEDQWMNTPLIVKSRITSLLGKNKTIYARKTTVKEVDSKTSAAFLNRNHLQGTCPSSIRYGLFLDNELVALMTFGKPRFSKDHEYELLRYCSKFKTNVVGGAGKLFSEFTNKIKPKSVVSYANRDWSFGGMYEKIGFTLKASTSPNYWYIDNRTTNKYNRLKYQKHKLPNLLETFDPKLSEWQNMQVNGYDRVWDCGNYVYEFRF